ncbi:MAG: hypothetical protein IKU01_06960 [Bacteroidales bacterium]|nr:hypothetical protein [Bacteroidales bacterium]
MPLLICCSPSGCDGLCYYLNPNMIYWAIYVVAFQAYNTSPKDCNIYSVWQYLVYSNNTIGLYGDLSGIHHQSEGLQHI